MPTNSVLVEEIAAVINTVVPDEMILLNWIGAMRSGDYNFGFGLMRSDEDSYDAFGVLAAISVVEWVWNETDGAWSVEGQVYAPTPVMVARWLGVRSHAAAVDAGVLTFTGNMIDRINEVNDSAASFDVLAKLLEDSLDHALKSKQRFKEARSRVMQDKYPTISGRQKDYISGDIRPFYGR